MFQWFGILDGSGRCPAHGFSIQTSTGDDLLYFLGAPRNRRCTAEHYTCLCDLFTIELQCQGNACQGKVPGSTGTDFSIGTVQSLRWRRQKNLGDDLVGFQDGLFLDISPGGT